MDSGRKSKTKIEKAFFIILRGFCLRLFFVEFFFVQNHLIRFEIFFFSKYDFMGIKNPNFYVDFKTGVEA